MTLQNTGATHNCARYTPLLPLASHGLLDATRQKAVRAHLATCTRCQHEMAVQEQLDAALRRAAESTAQAAVLFSHDEMLAMRERADGSSVVRARSGEWRRSRWSAPEGPFVGIPAIAAVLLLSLFAGFVFHLADQRSRGIVGPTLQHSLPSTVDFYAISMASPTDGWAVGGTTPDPNYSPRQSGVSRSNYRDPVLAHYHDGVWSIATPPTALQQLSHKGMSIVLYSVSMTSADEGWAVGGTVLPQVNGLEVDGSVQGILLRFTHGEWTLVASANDMPVFSLVRMRSATDGWAISGSTIYRFTGSAWLPVQNFALRSVNVQTLAFASDGIVWADGVDVSASGFDGDAPSVFLHFDGVRWERLTSPLPHARVVSIAMTSPSEGWAVGVLPPATRGSGSSDSTTPYNAVVLQYHNGAWQEKARYPGPVDGTGSTFYTFSQVVSTTDGACWAVGSNGLIAHLRNGTWEKLPNIDSASLHDVAFTSADHGWAVGDHGTVVQYAGGRWTIYGA